MKTFFILYVITVLIGASVNSLIAQSDSKRIVNEQILSVVTKDSLQLSGFLVEPYKAKKICVIWVHGAGQNFYYPSYVEIARQMAKRGYSFISINTRMHDIGCFLSYKNEVALRGGTYWGISSKVSLDIEAWIDEMTKLGYNKIVLVGHSAGGPSVREYQAIRKDKRVIGIVMASVAIGTPPRSRDSVILPVAKKMVEEGRDQDLLPMLRLSAGTYLDYSNTPAGIWDFYGTLPTTLNPAIARISCPLLAWFGTIDEVGDAETLERLRRLIKVQPTGPSSVTAAIIEGATHLYDGSEDKSADILSSWISNILKNKNTH